MDALPLGPVTRARGVRWRTLRVALAAALWLLVAAVAWLAMGRHEEGVVGGVAALLAQVEGRSSAPLILLLAFLLRPITLLPVTVLTAFCGFLLGPLLGFAVALVAVVGTSLIPYTFTRMARGRPLQRPRSGWLAMLGTHPFESVLAARLGMIPGDLVNMTAGLLRVPIAPFVAATAIGGSPGLLVSLLAGATLQGTFRAEGASVPWPLAAASVGMLVVSLGISRALRRSARPEDDDERRDGGPGEPLRPVEMAAG
jgi:uncharacterized membrane protein YdjX (TVP38/TMEM64 family)